VWIGLTRGLLPAIELTELNVLHETKEIGLSNDRIVELYGGRAVKNNVRLVFN